MSQFRSFVGTGAAADLADPDLDGVVNALEYALGGNQLAPGAGILPVAGRESGKLTITFARNLAATDVTLRVLAADSLAGPWTAIDEKAESRYRQLVDRPRRCDHGLWRWPSGRARSQKPRRPAGKSAC